MLLDAGLRAQLLEVNLQPALGTRTPLDLALKRELVRDLFDLAEIRASGVRKLKKGVSENVSSENASPKKVCGGFHLIYPVEGVKDEKSEKSEL